MVPPRNLVVSQIQILYQNPGMRWFEAVKKFQNEQKHLTQRREGAKKTK